MCREVRHGSGLDGCLRCRAPHATLTRVAARQRTQRPLLALPVDSGHGDATLDSAPDASSDPPLPTPPSSQRPQPPPGGFPVAEVVGVSAPEQLSGIVLAVGWQVPNPAHVPLVDARLRPAGPPVVQ
eukprot:3731850-Rhodomonas_salina.1